MRMSRALKFRYALHKRYIYQKGVGYSENATSKEVSTLYYAERPTAVINPHSQLIL